MAARWHCAPPARAGFQRHHLIPVAILRRSQMATMFDHLRREGFALQQFDRNGVMLPAREEMALRSGHALHRGPHRGYTDVIAARVEQVRATFERQAHSDYCTARRTAVMRLCLIQNTMRRALTDGHRGGFWLNRRDPMRLFVDRPYLDAAIDRMYALVSG